MSYIRPAANLATPKRLLILGLAACLLGLLIWHYLFLPAFGAQLGNRALELSNNEVSTTADYQLYFELATAGALGSVSIQFCSNDPLPSDPCTAPAGLDVSAANLIDQAGPIGFTISGASTANEIILTRTPAPAAIGAARYHFTNITNPSAPGSYYVRVQTYASDDASGPASDYGGIAFAITNALAISAEVPPYLIFCTANTIPGLNCANATGDYVDFGELSMTQPRSGSSQMLVATNAADGYAVSVNGTTLTSGSNIINPLGAPDVSRPGTPQFGFNLRANVAPAVGNNPIGPGVSTPLAAYNQPNTFLFIPGDTIVAHASPDDVRVFTSGYMVNVPKGQSPGVYVSTLTYICVANF